MKKQPINEQFLKMQKLAGLITESEFKSKLNEDINAEQEIKSYLQNFYTVNDSPYWKGIDTVVNDPSVFDEILEIFNEEEFNDDSDDNYKSMILGDLIELIVMGHFFPIFIKNLEEKGVIYDHNEEFFYVNEDSPEKNKAERIKIGSKDALVMYPEPAFDLLNFSSDISENVFDKFERFLDELGYERN